MTDQPMTAAPGRRRLSPLWQTAVICFVGVTVAGALAALSLFTENVGLFVILTLVAAGIAAGVGIYAAIQGWRGSQRAATRGQTGRAVAIALAAGGMILIAAVSISGALWIVLLFFL